MAHHDALPGTEAQLVNFGDNLLQHLEENPSEYGATEPMVQALRALFDVFKNLFVLVSSGGTRTPERIRDKNDAKRLFTAEARKVIHILQAAPQMTNGLRERLGLHIPKQRSSQQKPDDQPDLDLLSSGATWMRVRIHSGETNTRRRVARGAIGAVVWSWVGDVPPVDVLSWKLEGQFTRTVVKLDFGANLQPGTKVWTICCWFNRHGNGPLSDPLEARLSGLTLMQQAQQGGDAPTMQAA